jgi:low temperature requirement protein LtrA
MIFSSRRNVLREKGSGTEHKVAFVELFFDLVFVFAVTQTAHFLIENFSPLGGFKALIILLAVWWVWIFTSWVTNWMDPQKVEVRLMLFVLMLAGMVMSVAIPHAFDKTALLFVAAYVFMQLSRNLFMCWALAQHHQGIYKNFVRIFIWFLISGVLWFAGALADEQSRLYWWMAALALEYLSAAVYFYVPGLGRSTLEDWNISGEHMAERCGLLMIIALGESLLVSGSTFAHMAWTNATIIAFVSAFVSTVAMWWVYFSVSAEHAAHRIAHSPNPGHIARLGYTYIHILMVIGVVVVAAADEFVLAHPEGHVDIKMLIACIGGPVFYLLGNLLFKRVVFNEYPRSHIVGLATLMMLATIAMWMTPIALSVTVTAILVLVGAWETIVVHRNKRIE